ncbi:hypothetical protein, partial [Mycobacterium tuberculosis]
NDDPRSTAAAFSTIERGIADVPPVMLTDQNELVRIKTVEVLSLDRCLSPQQAASVNVANSRVGSPHRDHNNIVIFG